MYGYLIGDVPNLKEMMQEINDKDCEIVGVVYTSDSNQVIIFYDEPEEKPKIGFLRSENE